VNGYKENTLILGAKMADSREQAKCILCGKKSFTCAECKIRSGDMQFISTKELESLGAEIARLREVNKVLRNNE
jgi:hypothetical protein